MEESKNQASSKAYIIGALVITVSLIVIGISMSYAYFANRVEEINPGNKGVTISSGNLDMTFATSATINATAAGLVNDTDITTKAEHTNFSITLPSDAKVASATYNLYLTELNISDNLKSKYLKWNLYKSGTSVANGTFENIGTNTTLNLETAVTISKGTTNDYVLYIWLSNDPDVNQTSLLSGTFSGKVGFKATTG